MRLFKPVFLAAAAVLMLVVLGTCATRQYGFPVSEAAVTLGAGFRYSAYGPDYDPGPQYWRRVGQEMAENGDLLYSVRHTTHYDTTNPA